MTEDINKLPKWAQARINVLNNKISGIEKLLDRETPTKVTLNRYDETKVYLPDDRYVSFKLPNGHIEIMIKDDVLHVYSSGGSISILPQVTNVVDIKINDR